MDLVPCRLVADQKAKRRAPAENQDGAVIHKVKLLCDIYEDDKMKSVQAVSCGTKEMTKAISAFDAGGTDIRPKETLGAVAVKFFDAEMKEWFSDTNAKGNRITIKVGDRAQTTTMLVPLEITVPRTKEAEFRDFFEADMFASIANAQLELPIEEEKKPKKRNKKKHNVHLAAIGEVN